MSKNDLKKLIVEEVKRLLEYEYFVDDNGWATDDEGNRWFAGKSGGAGTYGLRDMRRGHRSGYSAGYSRPKTSFPVGTTNELIKALENAITAATSEKTKSFLGSVLNQYKTRGKLSDKQKEVVKRIFQQVGLSKIEIGLVDSQG